MVKVVKKMFIVGDYLQDLVQQTHRGSCKACGKTVQWTRARVAGHKRGNCPQASQEERQLYRQLNEAKASQNNSSTSVVSLPEAQGGVTETQDGTNVPLAAEKKAKIDSALGKFFCRTGIPFRVADSEAF